MEKDIRKGITQLVEKCRNLSLAEANRAAEYVLPCIITDMSNEEITKYMLELLPILKDLKLNSLEIADFIVMCEDKFGAEIEEEDIHKILTVQDLCDYIASHA